MELIKENELESLDLSGGPWREEAVLTDQTKRERAKMKAKKKLIITKSRTR